VKPPRKKVSKKTSKTTARTSPGRAAGRAREASGAGDERFWRRVEETYLPRDAASLLASLAHHLEYDLAKTRHDATPMDWWKGLALSVRDRVMELWNDTRLKQRASGAKRVYYLSLEYLPGRLLSNALLALDLTGPAREAAARVGLALEQLIDAEQDPGLGNGGLGRLAACFMDSLACLGLPAVGYGMRYDYGIFEQAIQDGFQCERPDPWLRHGYPWEVVRPERSCTVRFYGHVYPHQDGADGQLGFRWEEGERVVALPFDVPVPGYQNGVVNTLRLWSARAAEEFNLGLFNQGEYPLAVQEKVQSENLTKVLYPKDDIAPGKELRLKQEYFFVSASLQDILRRHKRSGAPLAALPARAAIQLNDTHPALAIPELMRLLMDEEGLGWDEAWAICAPCFGYTNHTIMPEALERWPVELLGRVLPRHLQIIYEVNHRFLEHVRRLRPGDEALAERLSIVEERPQRSVRMAHLAIVGSHAVNGVAALHTDILRRRVFRDFHELWPDRLQNKTNGVTPRRWLRLANPRLSAILDAELGEGWVRDLERLRALEPRADAPRLQRAWRAARLANKRALAALVQARHGLRLDPGALFDMHIKRIHEYKRQLLAVLHAIALYNRLRAGPGRPGVPRVVLFAGKAAPGYHLAKLVIRLIHGVAEVVRREPRVAGRLQVVFLPDYGVSLAQRLFPAADLSEQISTAGYEASGTGNMKFALNGALTIGTLDGANVEIREAVGAENFFLFGLKAEEVLERRRQGRRPWDAVEADPELGLALEQIAQGHFSPGQPELFQPLLEALLDGGDRYMVLADFSAYMAAQARVEEAFLDRVRWTRMSILNTARCGRFSSDRSVAEYARDIWGVLPPAAGLTGGTRARGTSGRARARRR